MVDVCTCGKWRDMTRLQRLNLCCGRRPTPRGFSGVLYSDSQDTLSPNARDLQPAAASAPSETENLTI